MYLRLTIPPKGGTTNCVTANCDTPSLEADHGRSTQPRSGVNIFLLPHRHNRLPRPPPRDPIQPDRGRQLQAWPHTLHSEESLPYPRLHLRGFPIHTQDNLLMARFRSSSKYLLLRYKQAWGCAPNRPEATAASHAATESKLNSPGLAMTGGEDCGLRIED